MTYSTDRNRRLKELTARFEASAGRIRDLQAAILENVGTMSPAELDRHLDALRAEHVRYDNIALELLRMTSSRKTEEYREKHRLRAETSRERIKY